MSERNLEILLVDGPGRQPAAPVMEQNIFPIFPENLFYK